MEIQEDDVHNNKDLIEVEETDSSLGKLKLKALYLTNRALSFDTRSQHD